jgi:hypothetical protein
MRHTIKAACLSLVFAFVLPPVVSVESADDSYSMRGTSSHWTRQEWTVTIDYAGIKNFADRPDEGELKGLSIEWQKPELDKLGNICIIRGQVKMTDDRKQTKAINWFQGVTVYLGMASEAKPDWSKGMNQADTLDNTAVTSPTGTFEARVDLREAKQDRGRVQSFQFGAALAKHNVRSKTDQTVVWNSRSPAIPSSVQMLSIPAAPPLSRELLAINNASQWPFKKPNGVELIRAVNALQPLGKERALKVLEEYLDLTRGGGYWSDEEIVFWIIRLLFEPIQASDRIPSPAIAVFLDDRELPDAMKWPLSPMALQDDVPFMLGRQIGMGGHPEHPSSHIDWARLHGVIRKQPLAPTADPLAAAEAILQSRRFKALDKPSRDQATRAIRSQALAMATDLVQPKDGRKPVDDEQWNSRLKKAAEDRIQWDAKSEQFAKRLSRK